MDVENLTIEIETEDLIDSRQGVVILNPQRVFKDLFDLIDRTDWVLGRFFQLL